VRQYLKLDIYQAKAIKKHTGAETINELCDVYREYMSTGRPQELTQVLQMSVYTEKQTRQLLRMLKLLTDRRMVPRVEAAVSEQHRIEMIARRADLEWTAKREARRLRAKRQQEAKERKRVQEQLREEEEAEAEALLRELRETRNGGDTLSEVKRQYEQACAEFGILPRKKCMQHLDKTNVDLGHYGIGAEGGMALALLLKTNQSISKLLLMDNGLLMSGAMAVAEMLGGGGSTGGTGGNTTLTYLDLSENQIGSIAASALCGHLASNKTLRTLKLRDNALDDRFDCLALARPQPTTHDPAHR
jgi:hypothetical protein